MLAILNEWRAAGSSRLDRDLDGEIDAGPGPAIWDAFYPRLFKVAMPVKGLDAADRHGLGHRRATSPTAASGTSRRTCERLNGDQAQAPFNVRYCANGEQAPSAPPRCGRRSTRVPGDPDALRVDATKERIAFRPGLLPTTIRYTNRPSGIQQVISFSGHRPR